MPAVAFVLGAAVVAMGMRVVVAVACPFGATVVAIGTRVEVAVALYLELQCHLIAGEGLTVVCPIPKLLKGTLLPWY